MISSQNKNITGYPEDWDRRRKKVYRRDNYTCQNCGEKGGTGGNTELHAHHVVPKSAGGNHSLSNLVCLCNKCHSLVHGHPIGDISKNDLNNRGSKTTKNDSESPGFDVIRDETLDLAGRSTEAMGQLSQLIISDKETMHEELIVFVERYTSAKLKLENATNSFSKFEENELSGLSGIAYESNNRAQLKAHLELILLSEKLLNNLSNTHQEIKGVINASDKDSLEDHQDELVNQFDNAQSEMAMLIIAIARALLSNNRVGNTITKEWPHCPICGLPFPILEDGDNVRECILCGATWNKKGIIWKKWACTQIPDGVEVKKKKRDIDGWRRRGKLANEEERYERFVNVQQEEIARLASYVTNILLEDES